ncbi:MAG TPA: ATP-dependent Clp protease proteolytic subunit [Acidobacteriaceae bacterium]
MGTTASIVEPQANPPTVLWAIFCGEINAANTGKLVNGLTGVSAGGTIQTIHILFQSWGGFVGDGVFMYNLLRNFPLEIIFYNAGHIASAGVTAFLGARSRKATRNSLFMIHKSSNASASGASADKLKAISDSLILEDARTEGILRTHLQLPEELWNQHAYHEVYLSGEDALKYGLVDEIAEFSPPKGTKVLNAIG